MKPENVCEWYETARLQREHELARGESIQCTGNYQDMGCYDCDGLDQLCEFYLNLYEPKEEPKVKQAEYSEPIKTKCQEENK